MWKQLDLLALLAQGQLKPIFAESNLALGPRTTACRVILTVFFRRACIWTRVVFRAQKENRKLFKLWFRKLTEVSGLILFSWCLCVFLFFYWYSSFPKVQSHAHWTLNFLQVGETGVCVCLVTDWWSVQGQSSNWCGRYSEELWYGDRKIRKKRRIHYVWGGKVTFGNIMSLHADWNQEHKHLL